MRNAFVHDLTGIGRFIYKNRNNIRRGLHKSQEFINTLDEFKQRSKGIPFISEKLDKLYGNKHFQRARNIQNGLLIADNILNGQNLMNDTHFNIDTGERIHPTSSSKPSNNVESTSLVTSPNTLRAPPADIQNLSSAFNMTELGKNFQDNNPENTVSLYDTNTKVDNTNRKIDELAEQVKTLMLCLGPILRNFGNQQTETETK
jgi:hypothetical protein